MSTSDTIERSTEISLTVQTRLKELFDAFVIENFHILQEGYQYITSLSSSRRETGIVVC